MNQAYDQDVLHLCLLYFILIVSRC